MRICVIGAGTSSISFVKTLLDNGFDGQVDIYDRGNSPENRKKTEVLHGFGGAGTYSDGKLSLSPDIGGELNSYIQSINFGEYAGKAIDIWTMGLKQGEYEKTENSHLLWNVKKSFSQNNMNLILSDFIHLGTDNLQTVIGELYGHINKFGNAHFFFNSEIKFVSKDGMVSVEKGNGEREDKIYDRVVVATGRTGSNLLNSILNSSNSEYISNYVDIGIRFELPEIITRELTDKLYEFKVEYYTSLNDRVRTFCVNPGGFVVEEKEKGYSLVNGHSFSKRKSENTNYAILVTQKFTEPFKDAFEYARMIAQLANKLAGDNAILMQRFKDFKEGRRSTPRKISKLFFTPTLEATPGDLNLVFPRRTAQNIEEFIEQLDKTVPGTANWDNLLYGVEAKFYSTKPKFGDYFKLPDIPIWVIGDSSGYTRGIIQASISGIILAEQFIGL